MNSVRKTSEGLVITTSRLRLVTTAVGLILMLASASVAAVHFVDRTRDAIPRAEFVQHVHDDSAIHASQAVHEAFQDSLLSQQSRDNHGVVCYVYHNPRPFCNDELTPAAAGLGQPVQAGSPRPTRQRP